MLAEVTVPSTSHRFHSTLITPAIQDMLNEANLEVADIGAVAVNLGPGSFTGIRTGVITARTMAQFLNLPLYAFNTFELIASQHPEQSCAIYLDAGRGKSYHAVLQVNTAELTVMTEPCLVMIPDSLTETPLEAHQLFCTQTLVPYFESAQAGKVALPEILPADFKTPSLMHALIQQAPANFLRDWESAHPLYIQQPSITIKPSPLGRVANG